MTTSLVKKDIDLLLIACGCVVGFAAPVAMLSRIGDRERTGLELLSIFSEHPFLSVPAVIFGIAGFTLVSVGLNGLRGKYADVAERFDGIYTTAATTSIVCTGAICILLALSKIVAFVEYKDFRVLATIIGALVGVQLAGYVDGNDNTPAAFAFAGGLMGYCAAPALLLFLGVAALLLFGGPLLTILLNNAGRGGGGMSLGNGALSGNQKQIQELRGKIDFIRKSGVAPHLVQEEVDKLSQQIAALGGKP